MKMLDLEKLAFEKDASGFDATMRLFDPVVKGGIRGLEMGVSGASKVVGAGLKGVGHALKIPAGIIGKRMERQPIGTLAKAGLVAASVPGVYSLSNYDNYAHHMDNPVRATSPEMFGRSNWAHSMDNFAEDRSMPRSPMSELAKEAGLEKEAFIGSGLRWLGEKARSTGFGGAEFLPKIVLAAGGAGLMAKALGPTAQTFGEKIQKKVFAPSDRINAEDEMEKARVNALGDLYAKREVKTMDSKFKAKADGPQISDVLSHIKRNDPFLGDAAQDPKLKSVMQQTMNTVYTFAPDVAKDHRAMQSILTEAVTSPDGGLSFQTVKSLAETQRFINQGK